MFEHNPEEFITKAIKLIKEQKATMIVDHISYDEIEGSYESDIFTAEKTKEGFSNTNTSGELFTRLGYCF